jgi:hypothetical protein
MGELSVDTDPNLLDPVDGFLRNARYLIHDRDPLFTRTWTELLESSGVTALPIPAQSPNWIQPRPGPSTVAALGGLAS